MISNRTHAAGSSHFKITRMISDQIELHLVRLPLQVFCDWLLGANLHPCVYLQLEPGSFSSSGFGRPVNKKRGKQNKN